MKNSLLTLGLGFGLGFLAVSFFVGPQKVQAEITGRVRAHQARKPLSEARAESLNNNYFHKKKYGKTKASKVVKKTESFKKKSVVIKSKKLEKKKIVSKSQKKSLKKKAQASSKKKRPLVLDFTS